MIRLSIVLLSVLCLTGTVSAQITKNPGVSFSANSTKSRVLTAKWQSTWSRSRVLSDKSFDRAMCVEMVLRNMQATERVFTVEVTFVAKTLKSKTCYRFDDFSEEVLLKGNAATNMTAESKAVSSREAKYNTYYYNNASKVVKGSKIEGFIARVKSDDKLLAVVATTSQLETIGKDEKQLQKIIDADPKDK